ncbi:MAG: T9SS type A sorting domain-containing protein, partial [Bacteroidia bacterium]|nr:T9SS type A sorting domain-containing protein [Bacteroidia bacterium]
CKNDTVYFLKINGCQGVEEFENNSGINVYPNPSNGSIYITADKNVNMKLINELGQVIKTFELNAINTHTVHVSDLDKGIYFIIDDQKVIRAQKIIVE